MGKLAVAGIGVAVVVGGVLWLSSGSSSRGSTYEPSSSTYSVPSYRPTQTNDSSNNNYAPQVSPKDAYDLGKEAWDRVRDHYENRVPRVPVEPPHLPRLPSRW